MLVVAPDGSDVQHLMSAVEATGLSTHRAEAPESVARAAIRGRPDVVVVDLRSGAEITYRTLSWVCRNATASALVISELHQSDARMRALKLGAFDHLVAPFDISEGAMRIELLVERRRAAHAAEVVAGDLTVNTAVRTVARNGQVVALTPRELDLLLVLIQSRGTAVPKERLLRTVWNGDDRTLNVVEANVSSLRRKLHGLGPPVIHTVHRSGYVFREVQCHPPDGDAAIARRDEVIRRLRAES